MTLHLWPSLVTCLALLVYLATVIACGRARARHGIKAPAVTGHPDFERKLRIQQNTLEQLVLFLPSLWIFCTTVSPFWGGVIGLVFVAGRIFYGLSYVRDPATRGPGFGLSAAATLVLLIGGTIATLRFMVLGVP